MALSDEIINAYGNYFDVGLNEILINGFLAIALILAGIFLGKIVGYGLRRLSKKIELEKNIRPSLIKLIISVIKWAIYIVFIDLALIQLPIPGLTLVITRILVVIPALVGSLILISVGFGIAVYLREIVEDLEITGWKTLSLYLYYFILFVFGIYALRLALISVESFVINWILIISSAGFVVGLLYLIIKDKLHNQDFKN